MKTTRSWGVLLGMMLAALSSAAVAQGHGRGHGGHDNKKYSYDHSGKSSLANRVYRVTDADSVQKIKMKPVLDKTAKRLEALRASYQKQEKRVLDSLSTQLKPMLKEDQLKKLNDWRSRKGSKN
ncbi:MAG: hypothetical protein JST69_01120 [Bacteroidetes bacterium]|nr:hypothetical protein [Bacteroidota bacterium]